jgi:O-antigen/teichoic acid export membrane protein
VRPLLDRVERTLRACTSRRAMDHSNSGESQSAPARTAQPGALRYIASQRRAFSLSILNQAVSSGTNFALGFFLVRTLSPSDYGMFGIGLSICYLYSGAANALLLTQMVVHTPDKDVTDRAAYAARICVAVGLLCTGAFAVAVAGALAAAYLSPAASNSFTFVVAVAAASACFVVKDFFVRQAYTAQSEARSLAITGSVAAAMLAALLCLQSGSVHLNKESALFVFVVSQSVGAVAGLLLARLPIGSVTSRQLISDVRLCWGHGKWALAGVAVTWAQSQAYAYAAVMMVGAGGVGRANAARLLVSPFMLLFPAVNQITMPRLAHMRASDRDAMVSTGKRVTGVMLGLGLVYSVALIAVSDSAVPLLLGPSYTDMQWLLAAWCLVIIAMLLRDGAATLLQAMKRFRSLTAMNGVSAGITTVVVVALMHTGGVSGAIVGTAAGEFLLAFLLWRLVRDDKAAHR